MTAPVGSKAFRALYEFATWARHEETREAGVHVSMKLKGHEHPHSVFFTLKDTAKLILASRRGLKEALRQLPSDELEELEAFIEHEIAMEKFLGGDTEIKQILTGV